MFSLLKKRSTFSLPVFIPSFLFVLMVAVACIAFPQAIQQWLNTAKNYAFDYFSWFYILSVSCFILFLLLLAMSSLGDIRLGSDDEEAEYPFLSWIAMLFAAGMGVGLMYFGVAEPLMHSVAPITQDNPQKNAMLYTFFHWGVHPWAIYGTIALALAYFGFRYRMPLSIRSAFYPLLRDKIHDVYGHIIDALALIATLFGIITTLGYGSSQLNAGLQAVGILSENSFFSNSMVIIVVVSIAVLSAISGVGKGVRRLSEINLGLALTLMLFVLFSGSTIYLLSVFSENIGYYLSNLVEISFRTFSYDPQHTDWFSGWTVLYWAWWFSWAPFVGLFIARISRGRTIREFILGVLIIPSTFNLLWFTIFGDSAILQDVQHNGALSALTSAPETLLFAFLDYFPLPTLSGLLALLILSLFFITSADSGIFVLNNIASSGKITDMPKWQSVLWGVIMMILSIGLLNSGGLGAVQAMTLVVALPFAVITVLMCFSLLQGLRVDKNYFNTRLNQSTVFWSGDKWKKRLGQILKQTQEADIQQFLAQVVKPAFSQLRDELVNKHQLQVEINETDEPQRSVELVIHKGVMRDFIYGVMIQRTDTALSMQEEQSVPSMKHEQVFEPVTYFGDGRIGYDVQYMTTEELIADVLKQYQRYLVLLNSEANELMVQAPLEPTV
ncbi:choline/glycine/proline betaine transport protein [Pasteurella testudinis DSM 23072]|uniref:Choline/glycine/proline betaine transport protein n=1 Tax=Pasteurella testudinis DSM 23072 TaxID=1122938 RepID=A0A1W1UEL5_9PAST|nr:BCCT family transporter [Pasteurella testudinis]SMB79536.1 choline/glycine/proline betaine transport protein [Pasteurella testudinis DSM 23072]SUB50732.1 putative transporter [Pasteurella testudinis]